MLSGHVSSRRLYPALILLAALFSYGCSSESRYDVRGRVAGFGDDGRTLIVEHEEIPGLMPAMTMPFEATDPAALIGMEVGDAVGFELVIDGNRSWIRNVAGLPDDAVAAHPAGASDPFHTDSDPLLDRGDPIPDTELVTHADTTLRLSDLEGRRTLLTFIYVRCPIPDFCPLMSRHFAALQPVLHAIEGAPVHLLSISFDPANDRPDVLRSYAERYTDDLTNWTFATGDPGTIRALAEQLGMYYEGGTDQIFHNLVTVLVDERGTVQRIWRGNDWTPEDVLTALRQ